jgi:hypothetical protein
VNAYVDTALKAVKEPDQLTQKQIDETAAMYEHALAHGDEALLEAGLRASLEDEFVPILNHSEESRAQRNEQIDAVVAWREQQERPLPEAAKYLKGPVLEKMKSFVEKEAYDIAITLPESEFESDPRINGLYENWLKLDNILRSQGMPWQVTPESPQRAPSKSPAPLPRQTGSRHLNADSNLRPAAATTTDSSALTGPTAGPSQDAAVEKAQTALENLKAVQLQWDAFKEEYNGLEITSSDLQRLAEKGLPIMISKEQCELPSIFRLPSSEFQAASFS